MYDDVENTIKGNFEKSAVPKTPADQIRDKDNAQLIPKPPAGARHPANLAPAGALGIRRNLVPKAPNQNQDQKPSPKRDWSFDRDR